MYLITNQFYDTIVNLIVKHIKIFPAKIYETIYDQRFNPNWVIEDINFIVSNDSEFEEYVCDNSSYKFIMGEIESSINKSNSMIYVCDNTDLGDDMCICGDYSFYAGMIRPDVPFLFSVSSHMFAFPPRLVLYGPEFQIEVTGDKIGIEIYETVQHVRHKFLIQDKKQKISAIKDFLLHTDRRRFDIE